MCVATNIFFAFKITYCGRLNNGTGYISVVCKEDNLTVTLNQIKDDHEQRTTRNLCCMSDVKHNHHHILFSINTKLVEEEDEECEEHDFAQTDICNTYYLYQTMYN